jgi:N-terminal acetyltransferase B complex catalytic subunit
MTTVRPFTCDDLFLISRVNLDKLTETYQMPFYQQYLATWPEYNAVAVAPSGACMGYVLGKVEGSGPLWHGHVTAVTVAPGFRRLGLARALMARLELISEAVHDGYFVDLFVRVSNTIAQRMYEAFGYTVFRRVLDYYSGEEDAFDMRKALKRDVNRESVVPMDRPVTADELIFN